MRRIVLQMRLFWIIWRGKRRFSRDPRYRMELVCTSFGSPTREQADDHALLRRICAAYYLAMTRQASAPEAFTASRWWRIVQESNLGPARRALANGDVDSLRAMYRQFFRDPCGAGLVGLPVDMARSYRRPQFQRRYKHLLLIDMLHRLEVWHERMNGRFSVDALRGPEIGAPFGAIVNDVFLRPGATDHHYYAHKMIDLLKSNNNFRVIAEIGGGFGGMAYYLIRDHPAVTYIDFDLPETIALAAYFLSKAFPHVQVTLYGEQPRNYGGVFLMPAFALAEMPANSMDAVFSSHLFSDLAHSSLQEYMNRVVYTAPAYFLHVDSKAACRSVFEYMARGATAPFTLVESLAANWNHGCAAHTNEYEILYANRNFSGAKYSSLSSADLPSV
ncbi:MAG: putative sugar O-methyltransferase [Bryobacteraceae bacterium]